MWLEDDELRKDGGVVVSNGGGREQRERLPFFSSPLFSKSPPAVPCFRSSPPFFQNSPLSSLAAGVESSIYRLEGIELVGQWARRAAGCRPVLPRFWQYTGRGTVSKRHCSVVQFLLSFFFKF